MFLHKRQRHTLNDIYAEELKLKRNQLKTQSLLWRNIQF